MPQVGEGPRVRSPKRPQRNGSGDCLLKTHDYAKSQKTMYMVRYLPGAGRLKGDVNPLRWVKLRIEAPVNGGRNYNGPKVAKFLVG